MTTDRIVLLRGGLVHGPTPAATALLTVGPTVAWVGADSDAPAGADEIVDLAGALVLPAFVDAHVHATHTGLALGGLDLSTATSLADALDRVAAHARARPGTAVLGTGWDETRWPERRPPTAEELERSARGADVYLARIDVHSAVASPALLRKVPDVEQCSGWMGAGLVRLAAHHVVRRAAHTNVDAATRAAAQRATRQRASALGIGAFHEMGGPDIAGEDDFTALLSRSREEPGPEVIGYWGELDGIERARDLGAVGAGGDLFVDGSVGSHTAWLSEPYADADSRGHSWLTTEQIARHVAACTAAKLQVGFHAIGDAALQAVIAALDRVARDLGGNEVAKGRPRLEHAELLDEPRQVARLGAVVSAQPAFDAQWGGEQGMYVDRLGPERARRMNPFAPVAQAGGLLAFGSDAPVTPLDPWGTIRAAVHHRTPGFGLSSRAAFVAHTVGGWRAAHIDAGGVLRSGAPATYAIWQAPDVDALETLPNIDAPDPVCVRTVVRGEVTFDHEGVLA